MLLDMPKEDLLRSAGPKTTEAILKVRKGDISITPGFDGEFGKIKIFEEAEVPKPTGHRQIALF